MARTNIFEKLQSRWDLEYEANCLWRLIEEEPSFFYQKLYTMRDFVADYCFSTWKNRGSFLKLYDFLDAVSYYDLIEEAAENPEALLDFIEIAFNLYYMAETYRKRMKPSLFKVYDAYHFFFKTANDCLAHYNHKVYYNEESEQAIVIEDKPEVTAVAELEDPDSAYDIIRYNHHALKGNLTEKRAILLKMGNQLEPQRPQLTACNKQLTSDAFCLLNNLNIRHNNCTPGDSKYKAVVAQMDDATLESWYDELYQMILLAKLELEHTTRTANVQALTAQF